MIQTDILPLLSRRVPRYTSYPTAVQFSADVGADTYGDWLAGLTAETPLSAYVHVPFCRHLCFYCGCHTRAERNAEVIASYVDALCVEIALVGMALPERLPLAHLHWGGGTPTEIGADGLKRVLAALGETFDFAPDLEHAIELDPRRLDRALVRALVQLGVNRVSFGVQTFDAAVQTAIGRVQPFEEVARAVGDVRDEGIEAISFDLMYGLPLQTLASVVDTVEKAVSLRPQRLSVFGYAHVPWMKRIQGGVDVGELPGPQERFEQMTAIRDRLVEAGYVAIGFDHFAAPDDPMAAAARRHELKRNFQGYTTDVAPALIGFGASAIGRLPEGYVQNTPDVAAYQLAVSDGRLPTARGRALTQDDKARAALIQDVLCSGVAHLNGSVDSAIRLPALERLRPFMEQGLAVMEGGELRVTESGWPFARLIASAFDAYLTDKPATHSLAV